MPIFERLSELQKKYLYSLGIYSDADFPKTFFEKIASMDDDFSESEKFSISDINTCYNNVVPFCMKDLIGTNHSRYINKTWIEAFLDLDRADENIQLYFENPSYYENLKENSDLGLVKKDDKYYIFDKAGGGNNRLILMKIKYLALASKFENVDQMMSFYAKVRFAPSRQTADNIFYLVFPNGGYSTSGYNVLNKSDNPELEIYDIVKGPLFNFQIIATDVMGSDIKDIVEQQTNFKR